MLHNIAQPDFEDILMRRLEENPRVDLRKGWTWLRATEVNVAASERFEMADKLG